MTDASACTWKHMSFSNLCSAAMQVRAAIQMQGQLPRPHHLGRPALRGQWTVVPLAKCKIIMVAQCVAKWGPVIHGDGPDGVNSATSKRIT